MNTKVRLLRRAKELIETNQEGFICLALRKAQSEPGDSAVVDALAQHIRSELEGYSYLGMWMEANGYWIAGLYHDHRTLARMAWIDKLIEEYSSCEA